MTHSNRTLHRVISTFGLDFDLIMILVSDPLSPAEWPDLFELSNTVFVVVLTSSFLPITRDRPDPFRDLSIVYVAACQFVKVSCSYALRGAKQLMGADSHRWADRSFALVGG